MCESTRVQSMHIWPKGWLDDSAVHASLAAKLQACRSCADCATYMASYLYAGALGYGNSASMLQTFTIYPSPAQVRLK